MFPINGIVLNQKCKPIYVRWPRVRLTVPPTTEGTFPFTTCKGACTNEENPVRKGSFQECSSFNHRVGPNQYSSHCQLFQKDQSQILDGYIEADDRYSFYWKYCIKSNRVCSGDYAFNFLSDRYMAGSEIQKYIISSTLEDCLAECLNQNDYICRSVTFNRTSGGCSLSSQNQLSKPAMIKLNNNPNFRVDYYENNCFNISESFNFDYKCEENGIRVKVDSKLPYTGALYGLYDFFTCKIEPKEETNFEYLFEYPTISKNCSDSIRFKGKEMILEVVLSTDGVEPLYFITPDDLTFQARCTIYENMGSESNEDGFISPDSLKNNITANTNILKRLNSSSLVTAPPKTSNHITPQLTLFPKYTTIPDDHETNFFVTNKKLSNYEPYINEEGSGEDLPENAGKISPLNDHENSDINKEFITRTTYPSTTVKKLTSVKYIIKNSTKRGLVPIYGTTISPLIMSPITRKYQSKIYSYGIDRRNKEPRLQTSTIGIELITAPIKKIVEHEKLIDSSNSISHITIHPDNVKQYNQFKEFSNITAHISFPNSNTIAVKTGTPQQNSIIKNEKITNSLGTIKETLTTTSSTTTPTLLSTISTTTTTTTTTNTIPTVTTTQYSTTTQKTRKISNIPEAIEEEITSSTVPLKTTETSKVTMTTKKLTTTTTKEITTTKLTTSTNVKIVNEKSTKNPQETTEKNVDLEEVIKSGSKKDPVTFEIFHNGQPIEAVVVGSRITLSFTPYYAISPAYMSITGCQVEPIGSLYDWEKEPLAIIKDGCQADHVGLVCPPQNTDYGVRVTVEAFRYQTTAQVQYTCLIRICPFAECPINVCNSVEGCPNSSSHDILSNMFKNRAKRYLSLEEIRAALAANPYLQQQLNLANDTLPISTDRMNAVLQQQLVAIGGDHVVRKRLIVVNSEEELKYYVKTGDVPDNFFETAFYFDFA
ncbi:Zona pellucida domain and PAN-1 domain and Apple-like domain-containing protein [Strongyloides ratti]|uniref:Zona pellucida domain and PAN-1 domain and Apple-like domain-containing protein n=1 Tax=Strongyloides ratti TaxID=34506 RepID=A0A090KXK0_STRRB|nr:Zona pellucida domain and PAN-1 domain and Apple-like domain-containing protein [Strongyloides ratti]CEF59988.1 Zona pellucida domain and PAN-1 domain and Apple-like domain-containing protein [Strongyloides ratti]